MGEPLNLAVEPHAILGDGHTAYLCGLSARGNFGHKIVLVWADGLHDAVTIAEEEFAGMDVHHAYTVGGAGFGRKNTQSVCDWIEQKEKTTRG